MNGDSEALAARLKRELKGEVRFDNGSRALYATDGSNYRQYPIGVVVPRDNEDVVATLALCREYGSPITGRGAGTSLAGQCCNSAVILDFSKYMNRILELDAKKKIARVQPGCVCDRLQEAAEAHELMFGPDPATHAWCTIGGMVGNNSCGVHSQMAGRTSDNVEALEVLTYRGEQIQVGQTPLELLDPIIKSQTKKAGIYAQLKELSNNYSQLIRDRFPRIPRRVSGYNLDALLPENEFHLAQSLVGSEGTCVTVLEASLKLIYSPPARSLLVVTYPDIFRAADHIPEIAETGAIGLEAVDRKFIGDMQKKGLHLEKLEMFPDGGAYLLVEFGGANKSESADNARKCMKLLRSLQNSPEMKLFLDPGKERRIWHVRESGLGATAHVPGMRENWEGWEDSAVAPERLGEYLRRLKQLYEKFGYVGSFYGHFGQGCVHTRIDFDLKSAEGVKKFREFIDEATSLVAELGGSLSGEHGDGQSRAEFLEKMFGPELIGAFQEFKSIWDPDWKMNPGKIVRPRLIDQDLRFGPHYNPAEPKTFFHYHEDSHSFVKAAERCVGVGKCRKEKAGTMCPSYMATGEEMHSTRGRARLLFEMLGGEVLADKWRNESVKEALDLCLACKGCKGECPMHVDMATYKAEFLGHYYKGRLRPLHAYAFGYINRWARLASAVPSIANFFSQRRPFNSIMKKVLGIASKRQIPTFAEETFKNWFHRREVRNKEQPSVLLWADTFNNYFQPQIARCATEILEDARYRVVVPRANLCCGRPLYDFGLLKPAKKYLENILTQLAAEIEAGMPVVMLEPSCCSVFKDELLSLLPHNQNAKRLRQQTFTLAEFLTKQAVNYRVPQLNRQALLHGHCHQKAIMTMAADQELLSRMGIDFEHLDSGCCGMAGAFGYVEGDHYNVSVACGERVLLPRARDLKKKQILITDGFSCREQVQQQTGKSALHIAEVLQMALKTGKRENQANSEEIPHADERNFVFGRAASETAKNWALPVAAAAAVIASIGKFKKKKKEK